MAYSDARNAHALLLETGEQKRTDATASIGVRISRDGTIVDAIPGTPGFSAGLGPGMQIIRVGGKTWSPDALRSALIASAKSRAPLVLSVQNVTVTRDLIVDYSDGLREPHLERSDGADVLKAILAPRAGVPAAVR